jgi:hypothetical protein
MGEQRGKKPKIVKNAGRVLQRVFRGTGSENKNQYLYLFCKILAASTTTSTPCAKPKFPA